MKHPTIHSLEGKRVIVLGGTSGIGLATAKAAAAEGAQVTIVSGTQHRINEALKELPEDTTGFQVDLGKEENIRHFFANAGKFDHLVYTAGESLQINNIADVAIEKAKDFFNIRYWGAYASVKYAAPNINEGGSINLTSGIASLRPGAGWSLGASICAAMDAFTRAMSVELSPIRVNNVSPGVIRTNLWNSFTEEERLSFYKSVGDALPVKRIGEAEDIAQTFIYLMKQKFSTGQTLVVDGGAVLV
jgi:NAD(P)-dependent dehydrogenase (short-subunit alcohol dehydrogenase family)